MKTYGNLSQFVLMINPILSPLPPHPYARPHELTDGVRAAAVLRQPRGLRQRSAGGRAELVLVPARTFPPSIIRDKNRRGIGKSQSKWTASKMETPRSRAVRPLQLQEEAPRLARVAGAQGGRRAVVCLAGPDHAHHAVGRVTATAARPQHGTSISVSQLTRTRRCRSGALQSAHRTPRRRMQLLAAADAAYTPRSSADAASARAVPPHPSRNHAAKPAKNRSMSPPPPLALTRNALSLLITTCHEFL
jgi:hypothetical protein